MWETRPVEIVLDLPHDIATTVEEVSHRDPDYLRRVIRYGIARRAVYQSLERRLAGTCLRADALPPADADRPAAELPEERADETSVREASGPIDA